jgi:hypothetical protein
VAQQKTASKSNGKGRSTNKSMKVKKSAAPRRAKSGESKNGNSASHRSTGDDEVTIERRRLDRRVEDRQATGAAGESAGSPKLERRQKVNRRRKIDPTTC